MKIPSPILHRIAVVALMLSLAACGGTTTPAAPPAAQSSAAPASSITSPAAPPSPAASTAVSTAVPVPTAVVSSATAPAAAPSATPAAAASQWPPELPLAPKAVKRPSATALEVGFDAPDTVQAIMAFYRDAMTSRGWKAGCAVFPCAAEEPVATEPGGFHMIFSRDGDRHFAMISLFPRNPPPGSFGSIDAVALSDDLPPPPHLTRMDFGIVFESSDPTAALVQFYNTAMPAQGWHAGCTTADYCKQPATTTNVPGGTSTSMYFATDNDNRIVRIRMGPVDRGAGTRVILENMK